MAEDAVTLATAFVYCIPPHSHALMRFRVHRVLPHGLSYFSESGVSVDRETGDLLAEPPDYDPDGPLAFVARPHIDADVSYEGVAPERATYFSSFAQFEARNELALVRYGLSYLPSLDDGADAELAALRQRMMDTHPDHGGTATDFAEARAAYEAARKRRASEA